MRLAYLAHGHFGAESVAVRDDGLIVRPVPHVKLNAAAAREEDLPVHDRATSAHQLMAWKRKKTTVLSPGS